MKLRFQWTSSHPTLMLRILLASGDHVRLRGNGNETVALPASVRNGEALDISPRYVAYGAQQGWFIRVYVDDVTGTTMTRLCITALYDDTVAPDSSEDLVKDEDIAPNTASDHPKPPSPAKTLTIPRRAS